MHSGEMERLCELSAAIRSIHIALQCKQHSGTRRVIFRPYGMGKFIVLEFPTLLVRLTAILPVRLP